MLFLQWKPFYKRIAPTFPAIIVHIISNKPVCRVINSVKTNPIYVYPLYPHLIYLCTVIYFVESQPHLCLSIITSHLIYLCTVIYSVERQPHLCLSKVTSHLIYLCWVIYSVETNPIYVSLYPLYLLI